MSAHVKTRRRHPAGQTTQPARAGFTIIELIITISIIMLLAGIVIGISAYVMDKSSREETLADQKIVLTAIQQYQDIMMGSTVPTPPDAGGFGPGSLGATEAETTEALLMALVEYKKWNGVNHDDLIDNNAFRRAKVIQACRAALEKLPQECWNKDNPYVLNDAWGQPMRYDADGGMGGCPLLESAGEDRLWGTDDPNNPDGHEKDNIRSDT